MTPQNDEDFDIYLVEGADWMYSIKYVQGKVVLPQNDKCDRLAAEVIAEQTSVTWVLREERHCYPFLNEA